MTRDEFEQAAYLEEELRSLENRPGQQARVRELRCLLEEARGIPRTNSPMVPKSSMALVIRSFADIFFLPPWKIPRPKGRGI